MNIENLNFKVKTDKSLPYHYIIGVEITNARSGDPGKFRLKYGPISYHNKDVEKIASCQVRMCDELFKQSRLEALKAEGLYELFSELSMLQLSCNANDCSIHHFSSQLELSGEDLKTFVEAANYSEETRKKLDASRINL